MSHFWAVTCWQAVNRHWQVNSGIIWLNKWGEEQEGEWGMWTTYLLKLLFLLTEKPHQGNDKPYVNLYIHLLNQSLGVPTKTKHLLFARGKKDGALSNGERAGLCTIASSSNPSSQVLNSCHRTFNQRFWHINEANGFIFHCIDSLASSICSCKRKKLCLQIQQ